MKEKGFSLVELMVVVAIIGILASIAVPRYQSFRARARQAEAKSLLNGYYTAAKSIMAQHGIYYGGLDATRAYPEGDLTYELEVLDGTVSTLPAGIKTNTCLGTGSDAKGAGKGTCSTTLTDNTTKAVNYVVNGCTTTPTEARTQFMAVVCGSLMDDDGESDDEWTINEKKDPVECCGYMARLIS